ncbi:long-chain-fatty-acid--CoA ligase [Paenibacillus harenae]|uniref:long-chain-fatty-acid--CoA ligase n=1 Tax=Paenibacillus harenae TaxID=306543 RepID=UPI00042A232F|nr:long-chain fatty acid--CoA ligase [Paenibacillus harenae]
MDPLRPQDPLLPEQPSNNDTQENATEETPAAASPPGGELEIQQAEASGESSVEATDELPADSSDESLVDSLIESPVDAPFESSLEVEPPAEPTVGAAQESPDERPAEPIAASSNKIANDPPTEPTAASSADPAAEAEYLPRPWLRHYPAEIPASLDYPDQSIVQFLLNAVNRYPNHAALHFMGKTVTYRELHADALRLAAGLQSLGVTKGDRVAIMLPNCPQAVIAYYGVLLAGGVVVQTNPLYVERELEHQMADSGAVAIITVDLLYARLARVRGEQPGSGPLPQLRHAVITSIKDGLPFPKSMLYPLKQRKEGFRADIPYGKLGVVSYKRLLAAGTEHAALPEPARGSDLAVLQYTGGTTGTPKGVMLTHRNLTANTLQTSAWCYKAVDGKEKFLAALPLFHVFGLTVLMNMSVSRAGTLVLLPRFETETVLRTINRQKPTIFPGAPTMYVALINHKAAASNDLSSINVCISGSAGLPLEVQEQFEAMTGGKLIEGYGLTEASPVTHANPLWGKRKIGTIGLPFPDTDAAVVNPVTGERLPAGELGELVIRGPQVMQGYWNKPLETDLVLRGGWLHTGDLATMDEDGFFTIMDRMKDVIIAGGFNIYPREVEEVLFEHPAVREAAVIGVKDAYRGESVKAFIVLKEGWQVSQSQLDRWCRERLAAYKVPHHYSFKETLPKTMVGKVLRRKLQEDEAKVHIDSSPEDKGG